MQLLDLWWNSMKGFTSELGKSLKSLYSRSVIGSKAKQEEVGNSKDKLLSPAQKLEPITLSPSLTVMRWWSAGNDNLHHRVTHVLLWGLGETKGRDMRSRKRRRMAAAQLRQTSKWITEYTSHNRSLMSDTNLQSTITATYLLIFKFHTNFSWSWP